MQNSFASVSVTSSELNAGGLVGFSAGGTVQSSHASGNVYSPYVAGGLIGWGDTLSVVSNSYSTGAVTADDESGGLMGFNYGLVTTSHATGAVTSSNWDAGGLIGYNAGTVQFSHASGAIGAMAGAGGLIGGAEALSLVTDSYATGAVTGVEQLAGGLIGYNSGRVSNSYATGAVTASHAAGGLIGENTDGAVTNSYAIGTVTGTVSMTGGLIGNNNGTSTVSNSFATGVVTGVQGTGGLVGLNIAAVQNSYATGSVTGTTNNTGGLIGRNEGLVDASYATGTVRGNERNGGLVGYNWRGTVQNSYATGSVFGNVNTGGLVGQNSQSSKVRNSYATGAVTGGDSNGGLIGLNASLSTVETSYATGRVVGVITSGGLVGYNTAATISTSYWNSESSGQATGIGFDDNNQQGNVIGRTTAQLQGALPAGFNATDWRTGPGLYPYLSWQAVPVIPVSPTPPATDDAPNTVPRGDANPGVNASFGPQASRTTMSFQIDQSGTGSITPLTATPGRLASTSGQPTQTTEASPTPTQTAATQNADDDIVTGSVGAQVIKSADGLVYKPLSQYDAAQYSGNVLPGYESQAGDATVIAMLLRGAQQSNDTPKIDQLFEPGKGLQWKGVNWENPVADKVTFSDGAGSTGTPGESFPVQTGTTDFAAQLDKGVVILIAASKEPNSASLPLLGIAMAEHGIVANDPSTGRQVLISYNTVTKTLGTIVGVLDPKTGIWTKLGDVKPADGGLSQAQLDQLAKLSIDRFVAVGVPASGARP
ncbi:MAG: GLUG motif-containing protein [Afipia sp.]|nr:GLUG motif-containing protein [Afipia sp.]